jgi:hypothetical protein
MTHLRARIHALLQSIRMCPFLQVEQLCAEYDTVDDFLLGLNTLHPQEY